MIECVRNRDGQGDSNPMGFVSRDTNPGTSWVDYVFSKNSEIPGLSLGLESQAVPRILAVPKSSHGTQIPGILGTGTEIVGTVPGF